MSSDFARELYKSWRSNNRRNRNQENLDVVRGGIEDPQPLDEILSELISTRDWQQGLAEGSLFSDWAQVVGPDIGAHSTPQSLHEGILTIQTSSTAWATQLTIIEAQVLKTVQDAFPSAQVNALKILPPGAPNWTKGLRTIKNARGPRDTYG